MKTNFLGGLKGLEGLVKKDLTMYILGERSLMGPQNNRFKFQQGEGRQDLTMYILGKLSDGLQNIG